LGKNFRQVEPKAERIKSYTWAEIIGEYFPRSREHRAAMIFGQRAATLTPWRSPGSGALGFDTGLIQV
jgi:hypothetical protein